MLSMICNDVSTCLMLMSPSWFLTSVNPEDMTALKTMFESKQIRPIIEKYYTIEGKEKADEKESVIEMFEVSTAEEVEEVEEGVNGRRAWIIRFLHLIHVLYVNV